MQLPIFMKHDEMPPPEQGDTRLVFATNGVFRERSTSMFESSARIEPADVGMKSHREYCRLKCGRINRVMHRVMLSFFLRAYRLHGGEAALVLLYNPVERRFRWHCPVQSVEVRWSVDRWVASDHIVFANPKVLPEDYLHFGDAHLHPGASSVPSFTDISDDQDGLHLIVANIDRKPSYHIAFVMDGKRFRVSPGLFFEDLDCLPGKRSPEGWMKCIDIQHYVPTTWQYTSEPYDSPGNNGSSRS